jgi:hypothetical protein
MVGTFPACCARAASGQPAKPLPRNAMNSRRLMGLTLRLGLRANYSTVHRSKKRPLKSEMVKSGAANRGTESSYVRFASKADLEGMPQLR